MINKSQTTAFIGLSHLGLVASICWAKRQTPVIGIDPDKKVIWSLKNDQLLIMEDDIKLEEPGLQKLFSQVKNRYYPTTDFSEISKAGIVIFAKDTPKDTRNPEKVIDNLIMKSIPYLADQVTIIIMSQVPIGFCRKIAASIQKSRPELKFNLYHWVDTIIMTQAIDRFLHPERIIIGSCDISKPFSPILEKALASFDCPVFKISFESAEVTKAAINFYLATSVTYANTLADICEISGADINQVIPSLRSDKRIGQYAYIKPNLKIAGGHLERDLLMLSKVSKKKDLVNFIIDENKMRFFWAIDKINQNLKIKKAKIAIWGLSYKKDSTSTKNAASLDIIRKLAGQATLTAYDPMAILPEGVKVSRFKDKYQALTGADCLLILTDWDEFKKTDIMKMSAQMKSPLIIDTIGVLYPRRKELSNCTYLTMGLQS